MTLTFEPFREVDRLANQLWGATQSAARGPRWMPMDLFRSGDHYVVALDVPGVDPGSIDIDVDGQTLTIRAQRTPRSEDGVQWLAQERAAGSFQRQLQLGEGLDLDRIHAAYDAGVLTVTLPVSERSKPRRITVDTAGRGGPAEIRAHDAASGSGTQGSPSGERSAVTSGA